MKKFFKDMDDKLTETQKKELQKLTDDMMDDAKDMVNEYEKKPSEISGSVVEINENSPFLEENFKGDSWKNIVQGSVEEAIEFIKTKKGTETQEEIQEEQPPSIDEAQLLKEIQEQKRLTEFNKLVEGRELDKFGHTVNKIPKTETPPQRELPPQEKIKSKTRDIMKKRMKKNKKDVDLNT